MKKKVFKISLIILLVVIAVLGVGGFIAFKMFRSETLTFLMSIMPGNAKQYNVENVNVNKESTLQDKRIIFLGSSVTEGFGGCGVSFVDYLEKKDGVIAVKEAIGGTTIVTQDSNSYIPRMENLNKDDLVDVFVCQLSTNDATQEIPLGIVSGSRDMNDFDVSTIIGGIEYIICYAQSTWNCPVVFYTNTKYDSDVYGQMVDILPELQEKWGIYVIDLWNDEELNNITEEQRKIYMIDKIHPTKAGYLQWWLPAIEAGLEMALNEKD